MYKTILKLIWKYGISLWGTAINSNIEILQIYVYQNKVIRSNSKCSLVYHVYLTKSYMQI